METEQTLNSLMSELSFPQEARDTFLAVYGKIRAEREAFSLVETVTEQYREKTAVQNDTLFPVLDRVSMLSAAPARTVYLLTFLLLAVELRKKYAERSLPDAVFVNSMRDLYAKLMECRAVYGEWGSFVAWWFDRFFDLTRFGIGRLQFETIRTDRAYQTAGVTLPPDTLVLNVHIPSLGRLEPDAVCRSFSDALAFYERHFSLHPAAFFCESWLLYPAQREFLPAESNILKFMAQFTIAASWEKDHFDDGWRVFGAAWDKYPQEPLPRDTSLRRAYADRLQAGGKTGEGIGIRLCR